MANVIALLTSARSNGFTSGLLKEAVEAAKKIPNVNVEFINAYAYEFGPCNSCFTCIRHPEDYCSQKDDMGRKGEGELFKKVLSANGLIIAQPVYFWGSAAMTHLFIERLYPFLSHNTLHGLPFASISCASNQGMMHIAENEVARWAFTLKFLYIESLPVHTVYYEEARLHARYIGEKLAKAALKDEEEGRHHLSDEESWFYYMDKPWNALEPYLENLTRGTFRWQDSLIEYGLTQGTITNPESRAMLEEARDALIETINAWNLQDLSKAQKMLLKASALWTHATFKENCNKLGLNVNVPEGYRPLQ
jgi:multimeric flavodoxin WrbA